MPPKQSAGGNGAKQQPTLSSFFTKRAAAPEANAATQASGNSGSSGGASGGGNVALSPAGILDNATNRIETIEPPAKRLKTGQDAPPFPSSSSQRGERVEQWRYVPPPPPTSGEDAEMDQLPSSSQRSADDDRRHEAFRKKLLGADDPIRRRDRQRAEEQQEAEQGDDAAPIPLDNDDGDDDNGENENDQESPTASSSGLSKFARNGSGSSGKKGKSSKGSAPVKYTPLEQQVLDLKARHPDVLLLFEVGYKFIAYEEDAVNASKELNIACFPKNNLRVASIPVHRIHIHARRLVGAGYKVGVVRQTETRALKAASSNASTPFTRELTELYTASTWVEDLETVSGGSSDPGAGLAQNSLIAIVERIEGGNYGSDERVSIGLIAVQAATGSVVYDQFVDSSMRSELETRLAHLQPAELLLPPVGTVSKPTERLLRHTAGSSLTFTNARVRIERTDAVLNYNDAFSHVSQFYEEQQRTATATATTDDSQVGQSLAAVMKLPHLAIIALATCLQHLQTFGLTSMFKVTSSFTSFQARSEMLLSTGTLYNLELFSTTEGTHKGSLLWLVDKCKTAFGKRTLRKWVGRPLTDLARLQERTDAVTALLKSSSGNGTGAAVLSKIPELLIQQPDLEKGLARMIYGRAAPTELATVLLALNRISHQFVDKSYEDPSQVGTSSSLLNSCIFALPKVRQVVADALSCIHLTAARKNEKQDMFKEDKYPQLQDEKDRIAVVEAELQEHLVELRKVLKRPSLQFATVSGIDYLVEVRTADAKKVPADWLRMSATKAMVRFHTPTITRLLKRRDQHKELLAAEAKAAYDAFVADLCEFSTELRNTVAALGTLDALLSLASVAALPGYIRPEILPGEDATIDIKGLRHPMSEVLRDDYVPNDVELGGEGGTRGLILTGANMGGKSSTVRAIALCVILAQIGSYIPASSARLSLHDSVLTRMGASDELAKGRSTFMVEAQEASEIMRVSTNRSLVILDELGRGTSTFDGQAIASAILTHLMTREESKRPTTLFITHYTSLCELASRLSNVRNVHMSFVEHSRGEGQRKDVVFLYKLDEGPASSSFGIHCAALAGLPVGLLAQAEHKAQELQVNTEKRVEERRRLAAVRALRAVFGGGEQTANADALRVVRTASIKLGVDARAA